MHGGSASQCMAGPQPAGSNPGTAPRTYLADLLSTGSQHRSRRLASALDCCQQCCHERGQLPTKNDKPGMSPRRQPLLDRCGRSAHAYGSDGQRPVPRDEANSCWRNYLYLSQGRAKRAGPGLVIDLGKRRALDALTAVRRSTCPPPGRRHGSALARFKSWPSLRRLNPESPARSRVKGARVFHGAFAPPWTVTLGRDSAAPVGERLGPTHDRSLNSLLVRAYRLG
jgi:hypothetical protein